MNKLCPCCGNRKGCDCYGTQSPQFRQLAEAVDLIHQQGLALNNTGLDDCLRQVLQAVVSSVDNSKEATRQLAEAQARIEALEKALTETHEMLYVSLPDDLRREAMESVCASQLRLRTALLGENPDLLLVTGLITECRAAVSALAALDKTSPPTRRDIIDRIHTAGSDEEWQEAVDELHALDHPATEEAEHAE